MIYSQPAEKTTKFKNEYTILEFTLDKDEKLKRVECRDASERILVELIIKDGELVESSAILEAQSSGLFEDVAKKFGVSAKGLTFTSVNKEVDNLKENKPKNADKLNKSDMVNMHMTAIAHHLGELKNMNFAGKDQPDWVESKIAQISSELSDITHYSEHDKNKNPKMESLRKCGEILKKCVGSMRGRLDKSEGDLVSIRTGQEPDKDEEIEMLRNLYLNEISEKKGSTGKPPSQGDLMVASFMAKKHYYKNKRTK